MLPWSFSTKLRTTWYLKNSRRNSPPRSPIYRQKKVMNKQPGSITQPTVAIITVTYNCSDFILPYLESVMPFLEDTLHRLFIVDNASSDNTVELIQAFKTKFDSEQIHLEPSRENLGFGKGCNKGAEMAQAYQPSHLWFLNPDTRISQDSGLSLLNFFANNTKIDFAGSILTNEHKETRPGAFRFPTLMNVFLSTMKLGVLDKLFSRYTTAAPIEKQAYQADWLTGASFMVKNSRFNALEGFDPFYFLYFEEVDLFYRAKKKGYSVWACPDSQVFHISGASTGINNKKTQLKRRPGYWFESRRYFYLNNFGKAYFAAVDMVFLISHGFWWLRAKLQGKPLDTPEHFVKDIIEHSLLKSRD